MTRRHLGMPTLEATNALRRELGRNGAIAAPFLVTACLWIYGVLNADWGGLVSAPTFDRALFSTVAIFSALSLLAGFVHGNSFAFALPPLVVLAAVPAGHFPTSLPEFPIWFGLAMLLPVLYVAVGLGVACRKAGQREHAGDSARRA